MSTSSKVIDLTFVVMFCSIVTKTAVQQDAIAADIIYDANTCEPKLTNISAIRNPDLISGIIFIVTFSSLFRNTCEFATAISRR